MGDVIHTRESGMSRSMSRSRSFRGVGAAPALLGAHAAGAVSLSAWGQTADG
jgi:hypothetical protein